MDAINAASCYLEAEDFTWTVEDRTSSRQCSALEDTYTSLHSTNHNRTQTQCQPTCKPVMRRDSAGKCLFVLRHVLSKMYGKVWFGRFGLVGPNVP